MDSSTQTGTTEETQEFGTDEDAKSTPLTSPDLAETSSSVIDVDDAQLCGLCQAIDFDGVFRRQIGESFVRYLGSLEELEASECPLCRIFASMAPRDLSALKAEVEDGQYRLETFHPDDMLPRSRSRQLKWKTNVLAVTPVYQAEVLRFVRQESLRERGYLSLDSLSSNLPLTHLYHVRELDAHAFDLRHARAWISHCEQNHHSRCSDERVSGLSEFRVLDCCSRQVVNAPERCRYVALSYVWGRSSESNESLNGLSKVIEDSIAVALGLGFNYLWADRICIDQSNENDKRHQIRQMDLVYTYAALTIIAASGDGPETGLPGVNGTSRVQQLQCRVQGKTLLSTLPMAPYLLQTSKWHTRGWTFQEGLLSKRRLIFTNHQVLFECNTMHCSEVLGVDLDSLHTKSEEFNYEAYGRGAFRNKVPGSEPAHYMRYVSEFSTKELAYREDMLNAFQGILNAFQRAKDPVYHFWGIPIFLKDDHLRDRNQPHDGKNTRSRSARFITSLFWSHSDSQSIRRIRSEFPSWSWAAWDGTVEAGTFYNLLTHSFTGSRVWFQDFAGNLTNLEDINFHPAMSSLQDRYSNILLEADTTTIGIGIFHFDSEREGWAKSAPRDGIYVTVKIGPGRTLYFALEDYDPTGVHLVRGELIALLPTAAPIPKHWDKWTFYVFQPVAMVLEKVGDHYERVGFFRPFVGWERDEDKWRKINREEALEKQKLFSDGWDTTRQQFRLG